MLKKIYQKLRLWISQKDEKGEASSGFLPPRVRRAALALIDSSANNILEIGCGEGLFLFWAAEKFPGAKITGLEGLDIILEAAKRKLEQKGIKNTKLVLGQAEKLDFFDGAFDKVLCLNMLYNLASREIAEQVIKEMARVVDKNGSIIFDIRNKSNLLVRFAYKNAKLYDQKHRGSLNAYTLADVRGLLKQSGLEIKNIIPVGKLLGIFPLAYVIEAEKI